MRKYFAPILIVGLILSWLVYQALNLLTIFRIYGEQISFSQKAIFLSILFIFSATLVYVLIQRIEELRVEDEDDLGKY